jgi:hypothetical protein
MVYKISNIGNTHAGCTIIILQNYKHTRKLIYFYLSSDLFKQRSQSLQNLEQLWRHIDRTESHAFWPWFTFYSKCLQTMQKTKNKTPWPESRSELYRLSNRQLSMKLVPRGQRDGSLWPYSRLSRLEPLLFLPSSSSIVLTRLSGSRSRPTISQKIW